MKIIKRLFSRTAITLLAILIQLLIYVYVIKALAEKFLYISIPFRALSAIFVLVVINRNMSSAFKVPWIIVLLATPILGCVLYLLFGYPRLNRKQRKRFSKIMDEMKGMVKYDESVMNALDAESPIAANQARYFLNASRAPVYSGTETEYFGSGEAAFEAIKDRLRYAQKFVFLEYFIIEEGKMWNEILDILKEKVKSGVEVKVLYDDFGCAGTLKSKYPKILESYGISCCKFNKLTPLVTAMHNNRDHRKILVIDGKEAFTGGFNLSDEYINVTSPFGYWKDSGIRIKGDAVRTFTLMFLTTYAAQSGESIDFDKYAFEVEPEQSNGYIVPFGDGPAPVYNEYIGEQAYLNIINSAKRYVYITTPYLIVDNHFIKALCAAAMRGVDVRIITPFIPDKKLVNIMTKSSYEQLVAHGVKVYEFEPGFIHAKSFVCDDEVGIVGTINLDYRSFVHHFECGVWMYKTSAIADMRLDYENTLYKCKNIDMGSAKLKWYQKILSSVIMLFAPLL